ncbi:Tetrapeptide transporter, OPT1/isp4 [Akanthomyces lecanii RCEF 1005]|uniref:Tetrapeptide transporter, OPT1/isp4 n=1 Tax=Akanthomyces lecanii RCEF 1005 TaxID=1081108 RepID=A0A168C120_CORDF|nr:Tetrapeptide transporter, OPT1/isp4 [Akanthomyces lecanii RCEF 1005]
MADKTDHSTTVVEPGVVAEKDNEIQHSAHGVELSDDGIEKTERHLDVTEDDLLEAKELAATYSLEDLQSMMQRVLKLHGRDPNFPINIIREIEEFLGNDDVFANPEKHEELINEMKIEAALITNNSPYAEVRAVVDNHDDPTTPVSTIRAWAIGIILSVACAFVNIFFGIRMPAINVTSNVPQLLAYPLGKFCETVLPDAGITLFGVRHSLNPGPFNKKEHMLITIMASISIGGTYTSSIIWIQALPKFFNQPWAINFGYQTLIALSTNFIGYSLAGITRRFLVYPSFCVWPEALVTIALNASFHDDSNPVVAGPFKSFWKMSRLRFFCIAGGLMFTYFWVPNTLFAALSFFTWMTWIAPDNRLLTTITGSRNGLGINPIPTFDWNIVTFFTDPLVIPFFSTFNLFVGMFFSMFIVIGVYFSNAWYTGYLPITSNAPWDHYAKRYNVTRVLDSKGIMDIEKYQAYSPPYLSAGNIVIYMFFFSVYTASITHAILYHRLEISMGLKELWNTISRKKNTDEDRVLDVHNRLMKAYKEVPEWWYGICLIFAIAVGVAGIVHYPTNTSPGTIFFGIALTLIFIVPTGIIYAMTGVQVSLNVLAEFIGGSWVEGNALAMCFFKTYGVITCLQAQAFARDLKLAHYLKIPPRITFFAQMVPTLATTFVAVGVLTYQITLKDVCTENAPFRFYCPNETTFFTAAVLWGTVGPKRLWGVGGQYAVTLLGFPLGVVVVLVFWGLGKKYPNNAVLRKTHPVVMLFGGIQWAPYNISYMWAAVPPGALSWLYMRKRFLGWWSKYNFVLSAALSCGIAISAIVQFFAVAYNGHEVSWWGNDIVQSHCEDPSNVACRLKQLAKGEFFGPAPGTYNV